jgi:hypothetical protein
MESQTHLAVSDSLHEGRLSLSVSGADTVTVSSVKSELGVVEEKETSVGEREHDVAEELSLGSVVDLVGSESLLQSERAVKSADEQANLGRRESVDEPCQPR